MRPHRRSGRGGGARCRYPCRLAELPDPPRGQSLSRFLERSLSTVGPLLSWRRGDQRLAKKTPADRGAEGAEPDYGSWNPLSLRPSLLRLVGAAVAGDLLRARLERSPSKMALHRI